MAENVIVLPDIPIPEPGLHEGWRGYYTRRGYRRWYWCEVVTFDEYKPVIRTAKGHYHSRPPAIYAFISEDYAKELLNATP